MAIITLWAGPQNSTPSQWTNANKLPSPTSMDVTLEEIWDAEAGRNANGTMIATYKAQKSTYTIKWGIISWNEFTKIRDLLTNGFFKFAWNSTGDVPSSASLYYRSEISYTLIQVGGSWSVKDISVQVIQK